MLGTLLMRCCFLALIASLILLAAPAGARQWTDITGQFSIQGEFVASRSGKVVIEKTNGDIISVPLNRLSVADQQHVASLTTSPPAASPARAATLPATAPTAAPAATPAAPAAAVTVDHGELAQRAQAVLKANCYACHGEDGASEGGFNFALNLQKVSRTFVRSRDPAKSILHQRMVATDDSAMPPIGEEPRPSPAEIEIIKAWIEAGSPAPSTEPPREFIGDDQVLGYIADDLDRAAERSRRYLRYFTLTHLYNAGVSEDELQSYRNAFKKLINSLSWNTALLIPESLDPAQTIFRIDMRDLHWNVTMWEQVEQANPYFVPATSAPGRAASEATQCRMPSVRADWFVFAASKPPLYHVMLGLPETDLELENLLRVNVSANIDQEQAIRAAFNRSGVSQNNRLIEWHKSPFGSYWKSYDFGGNTGRQNLFEFPLGPGPHSSQFQHDGGELIFSLPNGLQGYLLVDEHGKRIDKGPTNIVSDPKQADKTVTNGVSCMSCHYAGVIPKSDEVGPAIRANTKAYSNADDILALYREPHHLARRIESDAERFAAAMMKLGVTALSRSGEPISAMAQRFEQELDLKLAACEFGLSVEEFLKRLDDSSVMSRRFASLRSPGGVIKRDVFATAFGDAVTELRLVPDGQRSLRHVPATVARQGLVRVPSTESNQAGEVCRFSNLSWGVKSLAFSPSGGLLAAGKPDRVVHVYDLAKRTQLARIDQLATLQSIDSCAFTANGSRLLIGGGSGHIVCLQSDMRGQFKPAGQFAGHSAAVGVIAVSADGRLAISGGNEKNLRIWETHSGKEIACFSEFDGPIKACYLDRSGSAAMATDGATLLEISLSGAAQVKRRIRLTDSWAAGQAAAFSDDGAQVAVGDAYDIRLWEIDSGNEHPKMQTGEIQWSLAFTPDGSRLVSGGSSKISVWDVRNQQRIHLETVPESGYIQCLATSPDNQHAAVAGRRDLFMFRLPDAP